MKRVLVISVFTYVLIFFSSAISYANGYSFYEKLAIEKNNKLAFEMVDKSSLPSSQQLILSCNRYRSASCLPSVLDALKEELSKEKSLGLKSWKRFLLARVYFESRNFKDSLSAFNETLKIVRDDRLKAATLHNILVVNLILRDVKASMESLTAIEKQYPDYNFYERNFSTYPYSICEPAWENCTELISVSRISKLRPVLKEIEVHQKRLNSTKGTGDEFITISTELAKRYEKICPLNSMFNRVCPDALEIYKSIYNQYPNHEKADFAFLKIQKSKFAYEYEGDEVARSRDIIKYYGEFLKHYPDSPLSREIGLEYEKAKKYLKGNNKDTSQ